MTKFLKYNYLLWMLIILSSNTHAKEYYVSHKGSDKNTGSIDQPLRTINEASKRMKSGDTCYIREGRYHEAVVLSNVKGSNSNPLTFMAYNNEQVTLDGTLPIQSNWKKHKGHIYKTTFKDDIWQLFVDQKSMCSARWPNGNWDDGSVWDKEKSMNWPENGKLGHYYNENLKQHDFSLKGAVLIVNSGSFHTYKTLVTAHQPGTNNFEYDRTNVKSHFSFKDKVNKHGYFFEGKKELIDVAGEWCYSSKEKTIYFWPPNNQDPNQLSISGKNQSYAFIGKESSHIRLIGLNFFATTVHFKDCTHIQIEDCNFLYPSYSKRVLQNLQPIEVTRLKVKNEFTPAHHIIRNCKFEYMDGPALELNGLGNLVENCYIHHVDYSCTYSGGYTMNMVNAAELVFRRNTIHTTGASETFKAGVRNLIELNNISQTGYMQNDGSIIQVSVKQQDRSITRYNWVHNTVKQGLRFDNSNRPNSPWGENGTMHHNVAWKTDRIFFKGDKHFIFNNLSFDSKQNDLIISSNKAINGFNYKTITRNNICNKLSGHRTKPGKDYPVPGSVDHNWAGNFTQQDIRSQLRDPDNLDFRPQKDSRLIDQGEFIDGKSFPITGSKPDIGPYEYGDNNYWIPGFQSEIASTPIPLMGTNTAKKDADLMWLSAYQANSFIVYFGSSKDNLKKVSQQKNNIYNPGDLEAGKTYFWRIDCVVDDSIRQGDVWHFTVKQN
ncbi:right-handed parallel beta-helix repeat-containing protein [Puteibacter caeruleilacunae]|nr:right-handed parallel beta-helix repeat-containing protein [Puteibacter caeruleilacunae]